MPTQPKPYVKNKKIAPKIPAQKRKTNPGIMALLLIFFTLATGISVYFVLTNLSLTKNNSENNDDSTDNNSDNQTQQEVKDPEPAVGWTLQSIRGVELTTISISSGDNIRPQQVISGELPGSWFFEAEFPVIVTDQSGNELGKSIATATRDWMTDEYIPFECRLEYNKGENTSGWIILKKSNPSGLQEYDDEIKIQVEF
ncbi:hypothetical protein JW887_01285 [Candidatus Dojkabacteria bacterium]|nr:hypothetical protein [Candidatus Dojkabacteria bacterium]